MRVSSRARLMIVSTAEYSGRDAQQVRLQRRRTWLRITVASWVVGAGGGLLLAWNAVGQLSLLVTAVAAV